MGKKGERIRPCYQCGMPVKYVLWKIVDNKRIFHWANADGSHHVHAERYDSGIGHIKSIMREG